MQKSMDSAVSAIKAQQTKLDVTANNIANVSTTGFKKSRTLFSSMLSQTIRTASASSEGLGGINPSSVGMGVEVSSIDTIHEQGAISSTGRALDLAMNGEGFFTVSDGVNIYYTRNGAINLSTDDGTLALSNGMRLMGYAADPITGLPDKNGGLVPLTVPTGTDVMVQATTSVNFTGNISNKLAIGETVSIPFSSYDSLGTKHDFSIEVEITGAGSAEYTVTNADGLTVNGNTGTLSFDTLGKVNAVTGGPLTMNPVGAEVMSIDFDFSKVTMLEKSSDFSMKSQNGMAAGSLESISVTDGGTVTILYSNGMTKDVGYIGVALFDNPAGLESTEGTLFMQSKNSGEAIIAAGGENSRSRVLSGYLEGSNVDISEELTEMIKTQRAYQMSTKVITASDEILQAVMNIVR